MTLPDIITSLLSHASALILFVLPLSDQQTVHAWEAALQTEIHRSAVSSCWPRMPPKNGAQSSRLSWPSGGNGTRGYPRVCRLISSPWDNSRTLRGPNRSGCCCQFSLRNSFHRIILQSLNLAVPFLFPMVTAGNSHIAGICWGVKMRCALACLSGARCCLSSFWTQRLFFIWRWRWARATCFSA